MTTMRTAPGAHAPPPEWLTVAEVAAALGAHPQTVRKMARSGALPSRPHGERGYRFAADVVAAFGRERTQAHRHDARTAALVRRELSRLLRVCLEAVAREGDGWFPETTETTEAEAVPIGNGVSGRNGRAR